MTANYYRLNCLDGSGSQTTILYSPHTSELLHENGEPVAFPELNGFDSPNGMYNNWAELGDANAISPENPGKKSRAVKALKIQMGLNCNYSCSYCSQASHLENGEAVITNVDDAKEFLENLDAWLDGVPKHIEFWGGEPFVYWKAMQVLVADLRERFPDCHFGVVTNGSLLDEEKLEWALKNNISFAVSHDGPGQPLRGPDPLEDPETHKIWQKYVDTLVPLGNISFNTVITAKNCDVKVIRQWFVDRLGDKVVNNFEGVAIVHDNGAREHGDVLFSKDDFNNMQKSIYESIVTGEAASNPTIFARVRDFISSLKDKRPSRVLGQKCGMDKEGMLAVDLKGNALTCHNTGANSKHNIGNVSDFDSISLDTSWHWSKRESCNYCPVLQICQGSCMYLEGDDFADSCDNEFFYAMPVLAGVLKVVFDLTLIGVDGDIRRPKKTKKKFPIKVTTQGF